MSKRDTTPRSGRRLSRAACALTLGLSLLGAAAVVPAQADDIDAQRDKVNSQLDASRAKLADLSAKSQEAVLALQATQERLVAAQNAFVAAQAQEAAAVARKAQIDADLVAAKKQEADGLVRLEGIKVQQAKNTDIRDNIARQAYEGSGLERLAAVLTTGRAQDLADNMYVVEKVNDSQNALLDELAAQKQRADEEQAKLAETRRQIATLQLQAQAEVEKAAQARALADSTKTELASIEAQQKVAAAAVAAQRGEEAQRSAQLQAESDRIATELAERARQQSAINSPPPTGNGRFLVPVVGPFTSEFEWRINPILGTRELHSGLDIGVPCGTPVHASDNGTIIRAGVLGGYGNSIWIDHGSGLVTTYNHMQAFAKTEGAVNRGDVIGYVGTTGLSTGCHMHWEVRVNGTPVNPRGWF